MSDSTGRSTGRKDLWGLAASYDRPGALIDAAQAARAAGYRRVDALTPFPVEGLAEALGLKRSPIPLIGLIGGLLGGGGIYLLMWWISVVNLPLNIGGRPLNSWPAFIPITFEMTVLAASLSMTIGVLVLCRLPKPYHPVFASRAARLAVRDRFVLVIDAGDPVFDASGTRAFLASHGPLSIEEVFR